MARQPTAQEAVKSTQAAAQQVRRICLMAWTLSYLYAEQTFWAAFEVCFGSVQNEPEVREAKDALRAQAKLWAAACAAAHINDKGDEEVEEASRLAGSKYQGGLKRDLINAAVRGTSMAGTPVLLSSVHAVETDRPFRIFLNEVFRTKRVKGLLKDFNKSCGGINRLRIGAKNCAQQAADAVRGPRAARSPGKARQAAIMRRDQAREYLQQARAALKQLRTIRFEWLYEVAAMEATHLLDEQEEEE